MRCVVLLKRLSLYDAKKNNSGNSTKQSDENVVQGTDDAHDIQSMDELVVTSTYMSSEYFLIANESNIPLWLTEIVDSITSTENVIPSIDSYSNGRPEKSQLGGGNFTQLYVMFNFNHIIKTFQMKLVLIAYLKQKMLR